MHDEAFRVTDQMLRAVSSELALAIVLLIAVAMIPWEKLGKRKRRGPWDKK